MRCVMFDGTGNNFEGCETLSPTNASDGANYKVPSTRVQPRGCFKPPLTSAMMFS